MNETVTPTTQNELLLRKLLEFYKDPANIDRMLSIINGESNISLRIVDWFVTNYSKKHFTSYSVASSHNKEQSHTTRFKVYVDYKLKLRAYSKKRFDPFCRWDRIAFPYKDGLSIQTTIGQLNFFKWAQDNNVIEHIRDNYEVIENDMNERNSTSKKAELKSTDVANGNANANTNANANKTRKKREELSAFASRSIKKENVEITVSFNI